MRWAKATKRVFKVAGVRALEVVLSGKAKGYCFLGIYGYKYGYFFTFGYLWVYLWV